MQTGTPHRSLKEKQRQERADLILQAAEAVLAEKGYHETSMDEIAARVGVAKGTVYLHFPSKEDLVFALFERELETFLHSVEQIAASAVTAHGKLEAILREMYKGLLGKRMQLLLSFYSSMDVRKGLIEKKEQLHTRLERLSATITTLLEEGKAAGEFDATIPTAVMVSIFFSLLSPQAYKRLVIEEQMSPEELVTHLGRIYFKGIDANQ
jgi:TetR/AcrR family transcriptional regulator, fatty acid metabolism regulator protein